MISRRSLMWLGFAALAIALLGAAWRYTPLSQLLTREHVSAWAKLMRTVPWAPAVLVAAYVPATFLMFPRQILTLLATLAFGAWLGFAYSMTGVLLAAIAAYYAGRAGSPRRLDALMPGKLEQIKKKLHQHSIVSIMALRVLPTAPFLIESAAAGALRINVWQYALGTVLGMAPGVLMLTVFGHQISAALDDASKINYWLLGGAVVIFGALFYGLRRWLRNH